MGFAVVRAVRSGEVVKPPPFVELGFQIDGIFVAEPLVEFRLIGTMGPLAANRRVKRDQIAA